MQSIIPYITLGWLFSPKLHNLITQEISHEIVIIHQFKRGQELYNTMAGQNTEHLRIVFLKIYSGWQPTTPFNLTTMCECAG